MKGSHLEEQNYSSFTLSEIETEDERKLPHNLVFFSIALTVLGLAPPYVSIPGSFVDVLLKTDESSTAGQSLVQTQHPLLSPLSFC